MSEEEIKEYLKRVDALELKLTGEDKDTYQWLLFGYNECARLLNEKEQENSQLKEVIETLKNTNALLIKQKYQLEQDVDRFYSRIEKAIEYIGSREMYNDDFDTNTNKLLEILKGDNE